MQALSQLSYTPLQNRNEIIWTNFALVNTLFAIRAKFFAKPPIDGFVNTRTSGQRALDARHDSITAE